MAQGSGTIVALNGSVAAATQDYSVAGFLITGTWVGTVSIEATIDDVTWFAISAVNPVTSGIVTTFSANTQLGVHCGTYSQVRLKATAFTSGTITVNWNVGISSNFNTIATWMGSSAPTVGQKTMANSIPLVLSSDQTFANPTDLFIGQATNNATYFSVATDQSMATGNSDNTAILIRNPNGSGKTLYVKYISGGTQISNVSMIIRAWVNPTVTANGTSTTPVNRLAGSGTASVALATTLPTVSAFGTQVANGVQGQNTNGPVVINEFGLVIPANNSLLISGQPLSNNRNCAFTVSWVEI